MGLSRIEILTFRNISGATLDGFSHTNVIFGKNGSGKTSFLEAIYFAGMASSFRSPNINKIISWDADLVRVLAFFSTDSSNSLQVGVERSRKKTQIRVSGKPVNKKSDLVRLMPLQLVDPDSHQIMDLGPRFRRQMIDWGVFHVEHRYIHILRHYMQHLRQRNHLLRIGASDLEISAWTQGLAEAGTELHKVREKFVLSLANRFSEVCQSLLDMKGLEISYNSGWAKNEDLLEVLNRTQGSDRERGFTQLGPHRCDLHIKLKQANAKEIISRGQQKLLICALKIAQMFVIEDITSRQGILLVDDLPAELDTDNRERLIAFISKLPYQSFITTTDPDSMAQTIGNPGMFHVEQGTLKSH